MIESEWDGIELVVKLVSQELTSLKQDSITHTPVIPVPQPSSPIHCPSPARVLSLINPVAATNPVYASVVVNDAAIVPYMFQSTMQQVLPDQGSVGPPDLFMTGGDISRRLSRRIPIKCYCKKFYTLLYFTRQLTVICFTAINCHLLYSN